METTPERGSLETQPLPLLLLGLYRRRASGRLDLERDGVRKRIWLREGVPVLAESNLSSESLGIQLLDSRRITREDYARVVETVRERRCREGAALLALELARPQELFVALKEQLRRRLLDCLGWPRGSFAFDPEDPPAPDAAAFRSDPVALVHEGVSVHWSPSRLREALGPRLGSYAVPTHRSEALGRRLHQDPDVARLLAELDGSRTLETALAEVRGPTALAAAWVLDALGALRWSEAPVEPAGSSEDGEAGEPEFELVFDGGGDTPAARAAPGRPAAAAAPAARAPSADADALRREIEELHRSLAGRDHYALLGLQTGADLTAIKRAYFAAAKRFHPDTLGRLGLTDLRAAAQQVFARIVQAYETLGDPERRREYDRSLAGEAQDTDVSRVVQAEALYRKGEVLLRAGNFNGAIEFLQPAVQLWPDEGAYQAALGWALYKKRPSDTKAARTHLQRAVGLDPRDAVAQFRLGLVLRSLGDTAAADRAMATAKRLDPKVR
jgi:tetratricopeptide (TPR) repeat protein